MASQRVTFLSICLHTYRFINMLNFAGGTISRIVANPCGRISQHLQLVQKGLGIKTLVSFLLSFLFFFKKWHKVHMAQGEGLRSRYYTSFHSGNVDNSKTTGRFYKQSSAFLPHFNGLFLPLLHLFVLPEVSACLPCE